MIQTEPATLTETFQKARDILAASPDSWIQLANARTSKLGHRVLAQDRSATCWCMTGVLLCSSYLFAIDAMKFLENRMDIYLPLWNDKPGRTREEVIAALDRAMELSKDLIP